MKATAVFDAIVNMHNDNAACKTFAHNSVIR